MEGDEASISCLIGSGSSMLSFSDTPDTSSGAGSIRKSKLIEAPQVQWKEYCQSLTSSGLVILLPQVLHLTLKWDNIALFILSLSPPTCWMVAFINGMVMYWVWDLFGILWDTGRMGL